MTGRATIRGERLSPDPTGCQKGGCGPRMGRIISHQVQVIGFHLAFAPGHQGEVEHHVAVGQQAQVQPRGTLRAVEKGFAIRRIGLARVGDGQVAQAPQEPEEAKAFLRVVVITGPAHPRSRFAPDGAFNGMGSSPGIR